MQREDKVQMASGLYGGCISRLLVVAVSLVSISSVQADAPVFIVVYHRGDDAYTSRFRDELESVISNAQGYELATSEVKGDLSVIIPGPLEWKKRLWMTVVSFHAELQSNGKRIGSSRGACRQKNLKRCAEKLFRDVREIGRVVRQKPGGQEVVK